MSDKPRSTRRTSKPKTAPPPAEPRSLDVSELPPITTLSKALDPDLFRGALGKAFDPKVLGEIGSAVKGFALTPEYRDAVDKLRVTNAARIEQAADTASRARALERDIAIAPVPSVAHRQLATMTALQKEMSHVAGIVVTMADSTTRLLEVAGDAQEGLLGLSAVAEATQVETAKLRTALESGQVAAERASNRLERLTWVLVALTAVLVVLTGVLLNRPA